MIKHKKAYILVLVITAVIFVFVPKPFVLAVLAAEIAFVPLLALLLKYDSGHIDIKIETLPSAGLGKSVAVSLSYENSKLLIAASAADITLSLKNLLTGEKTLCNVKMPLSGNVTESFELMYDMCGETVITADSLVCTDIFGFTQIRLKCTPAARIMIMPEEFDISIHSGNVSRLSPESGAYSVSRRGDDSTEVFELRDYMQGDDIKTVHWKLSGKMEHLIVKEYSDATWFNTIVLYDIALSADGERLDKHLLSTAVGAAQAYASALLKSGVPHTAAIAYDGRIITFPVSSKADAADFVTALLSHPLADENGSACLYMLAEKLERSYERVVYFTAGSVPSQLSLFPANVNLTAILINGEGAEPAVSAPQPQQMLFEIPSDYIRQNKKLDISIQI